MWTRDKLKESLTQARIHYLELTDGEIFVDYRDAPEGSGKGKVIVRLMQQARLGGGSDIGDKGIVFFPTYARMYRHK